MPARANVRNAAPGAARKAARQSNAAAQRASGGMVRRPGMGNTMAQMGGGPKQTSRGSNQNMRPKPNVGGRPPRSMGGPGGMRPYGGLATMMQGGNAFAGASKMKQQGPRNTGGVSWAQGRGGMGNATFRPMPGGSPWQRPGAGNFRGGLFGGQKNQGGMNPARGGIMGALGSKGMGGKPGGGGGVRPYSGPQMR